MLLSVALYRHRCKYCEISAESSNVPATAASRNPQKRRKESSCLRVQHVRKAWAGSMAQIVLFNWKAGLTATSQPTPEESFRDRSGLCFWMAAHQNLGLHPRLVQPLVLGETPSSARESPLWLGGSPTSRSPHLPAKMEYVSRGSKNYTLESLQSVIHIWGVKS